MQVLGRIGFAKDYFSKGLSESPAEGSGREELADVEDLISDKSEVCNRPILKTHNSLQEESGGTSGPPPGLDSDGSTDTEPFDPEEEARLNQT